jgi:hypothetical protein
MLQTPGLLQRRWKEVPLPCCALMAGNLQYCPTDTQRGGTAFLLWVAGQSPPHPGQFPQLGPLPGGRRPGRGPSRPR